MGAYDKHLSDIYTDEGCNNKTIGDAIKAIADIKQDAADLSTTLEILKTELNVVVSSSKAK